MIFNRATLFAVITASACISTLACGGDRKGGLGHSHHGHDHHDHDRELRPSTHHGHGDDYFDNEPLIDGSHMCGTNRLSEEERLASDEVVRRWKENGGRRNLQQTKWVVPVYWHNIHSGNTGYMSDQMVNDSIDVLNQAFSSNGADFL